jgi:hypothetical protein
MADYTENATNSVDRLYSNQARRPTLAFARRPRLAPLQAFDHGFFPQQMYLPWVSVADSETIAPNTYNAK